MRSTASACVAASPASVRAKASRSGETGSAPSRAFAPGYGVRLSSGLPLTRTMSSRLPSLCGATVNE
jgi:hypothetical protein